MRTNQRTGQRLWALVVVSALAVIAACSDDSGSGLTESVVDSSSDEAGDGASTEAGERGPGGPAVVDDPPEEPLAVVEGPSPWSRLEITDLRRSNEVVTVEFVIIVDEGEDYSSANRVFSAQRDHPSALGGQRGQGPLTSRQRSVSGVTLVDTVNSKRHVVLRDSDGACLCTEFEDRRADAGRYPHSAQFDVPPDDVESMTVQMPLFPAVDNVPLRRAG